jgi:hypothetical protein
MGADEQMARPGPEKTKGNAPMKSNTIARMSSICAIVLALSAGMQTGAALAQDVVTLKGLALDTADNNRFFTRLGGTVGNALTYTGLSAGEPYTASAQLHNLTTKSLIGEATTMTFTPAVSAGTVNLALPVPQNRTEFNIDYVVMVSLYKGRTAEGKAVAKLDDLKDPSQTIQLHAIQGIRVVAAAAGGGQSLPGQGGKIVATVNYVNMVEGYAYTIWGQLLTPSGQGIGVFSSIPEYAPKGKAGSVSLEFEVPAGFEGISLVPTVGLYHKRRVEIGKDGNLTWIPGSPMPVMIASDLSLDAPEQTIAIGVPFVVEPAK